MNAHTLATLALETWRASGPRTEQRRDDLVEFYAQSYMGPASTWGAYQIEELISARRIVRRSTRIDELVYA